MTPRLSFVIPFYRKAKAFHRALIATDAYHCCEVELVCVLDDPSDEADVLNLVKLYPYTKFRVIVNNTPHIWRPPCSAVNVGVRHALASHVAILSPESILKLPTPRYLQEMIDADFRAARVGLLWHIPVLNEDQVWQPSFFYACADTWLTTHAPDNFGYGFILCQKWAFEQIRGMDETRTGYGKDDDDLRFRLARFGVNIVIDGRIQVLHMTHETPRRDPMSYAPAWPGVVAPQKDWGREFSRVAYDWNI